MLRNFSRILIATFLAGTISATSAAEDGAWSVSKSSGEVWVTTSGAQPASLSQQADLKPGDSIRTGRTGRVLLVRGEETILISPNSVIGLPTEKKDGLSTTIMQQAGSILLDVEKRNVKHFEVETPYLAAVVKGTQFRVSVNASSTSVDVLRGKVEVADFKSGQIAQVLPGQMAKSFAEGKPGLSLSGSGTFSPIEQGKPRASTIERISVPKGGLSAPHNAANGRSAQSLPNTGSFSPSQHNATNNSVTHGMRISAPLGEVSLNFQKVTHGLAHGSDSTPDSKGHANKDTIWNSHDSKGAGALSSSQSSDTGNGNATTSQSSAAPSVAAVTGPASNGGNDGGPDNGPGKANGNGKGKDKDKDKDKGKGPGPGGPGPGPGGPGPGPGGPGNGNGNWQRQRQRQRHTATATATAISDPFDERP